MDKNCRFMRSMAAASVLLFLIRMTGLAAHILVSALAQYISKCQK